MENIDLEGITYLYSSGNLSQLKSVKGSEEPHTLVDNMGNVFGQFVITKLEEKQTSFFPCGLPKKVEFNLSLKRYS